MYDRILIVLDDDLPSQTALQEGLALARAHGAEAVLLGLMPPNNAPVSDLPVMGVVGYADIEPHARQDAERRLQAATDTAAHAGVRHRGLVADGLDPVHSITDTALRLHCDLVVVGSEGRNAVMRLLTGSVIPGLITRAPVPVLVCRECSPGARTMHLAGPDHTAPRRRAGTGSAPP
jgi:nucleotide-binding universal stress UspA family protein